MLKLLLLMFISKDRQTALLIEFIPVSSTSAFSLPKLFDAKHLYSPKCSLLTFWMIKVWSVPLLSIRKLLSFSNRSDFRYHLKESHLIYVVERNFWKDVQIKYLSAYLTLAGGSAVTIQERLAMWPTPEWTVTSSAATSGLSAKIENIQMIVQIFK